MIRAHLNTYCATGHRPRREAWIGPPRTSVARDGFKMGLRRHALVAAMAALAAGCGESEERKAAPTEPLPLVEVRASVDKAVATTGDQITYTVVVERQNGIKVDIPEPGAEIAGFRIVDSQAFAPEEDRGRIVERRTYTLRADLVGSYVLPEVSVTYTPPGAKKGKRRKPAAKAAKEKQGQAAKGDGDERVTVKTSRIFVEVKSVLPKDGSAKDIRDIKPIARPDFGIPTWVWVASGAGALVLVAIGVLLLWRWRRRRVEELPARPPHEVAFAALDALRATDFDDPKAVRRYYFAISEVVRQYVESRFGLNATDMTTKEILESARSVKELQTAEVALLGRFLQETDRVKFADHRPAEEEIRARYDEAVQFIQNTTPREEELVQSDGSKTAEERSAA